MKARFVPSFVCLATIAVLTSAVQPAVAQDAVGPTQVVVVRSADADSVVAAGDYMGTPSPIRDLSIEVMAAFAARVPKRKAFNKLYRAETATDDSVYIYDFYMMSARTAVAIVTSVSRMTMETTILASASGSVNAGGVIVSLGLSRVIQTNASNSSINSGPLCFACELNSGVGGTAATVGCAIVVVCFPISVAANVLGDIICDTTACARVTIPSSFEPEVQGCYVDYCRLGADVQNKPGVSLTDLTSQVLWCCPGLLATPVQTWTEPPLEVYHYPGSQPIAAYAHDHYDYPAACRSHQAGIYIVAGWSDSSFRSSGYLSPIAKPTLGPACP